MREKEKKKKREVGPLPVAQTGLWARSHGRRKPNRPTGPPSAESKMGHEPAQEEKKPTSTALFFLFFLFFFSSDTWASRSATAADR